MKLLLIILTVVQINLPGNLETGSGQTAWNTWREKECVESSGGGGVRGSRHRAT